MVRDINNCKSLEDNFGNFLRIPEEKKLSEREFVIREISVRKS